MKRFLLAFAGLFAAFSLLAAPKTETIPSPDGKIVVAINYSGSMTFSVGYTGGLVLYDCPVQMKLDNGKTLGKGKVQDVVKKQVDDVIRTEIYHKKDVRDVYNEATFVYKDHDVIFRVYNDGVAYRIVSRATNPFKVMSETVTYNIAEDWPMYVSYVRCDSPSKKSWENQFHNNFENTYEKVLPSAWNPDRLAFLPLLIEIPNGPRICITEADLRNYPGMYLYNGEKKKTILSGVFPAYPIQEKQGGHNELEGLVNGREKWIAKCDGATEFPWRVIAITPTDIAMADNDIVYRLAKPADPTLDFSWVRPGKVAWDWWNDWSLYNVPFEAGINNETYQHYIDFAAENHIEYVILDEGWAVKGQADLFKVVPEIDIEQLVRYGREKGVGIILWAGYWAFNKDMEKVCKYYSEVGVKGFKVDFMNRDDQQMVSFVTRAAEMAAKYHLILDFHGIYKPTGLNRTWPNVLNFEGIFGLEQTKWDNDCDLVTYDVTAPYIRFVAGPADYTQGAMRNATKKSYKAVYSEPMSQGTRCHQLAEYVIFKSPLAMLCDSPSNYVENRECLDFIAHVPTVWDKTQPLGGTLGEFIVLARRSEEVWYIAGLNNWDPRDVTVDLSFYKNTDCFVEVLQDGPNAHRVARDYVHNFYTTDKTQSLTIHMAPGGGFVIKIIKQPKVNLDADIDITDDVK